MLQSAVFEYIEGALSRHGADLGVRVLAELQDGA